MGFRGEALASIASVSEFMLTSRYVDSDMAWQIRLQEDTLEPIITPAAHAQGTTIEVANLFYNTPARRKFLKAERTEFTHIEETVKALALVAFQTSLTLTHNDKVIFDVRLAADEHAQAKRVAKLLGKRFIEEAQYFTVERLGFTLSGWVLPEDACRPHADIQYFFVNQRMMKDKLLRHAVNSVYMDAIQAGRYPAYLLYLDCDPAVVDVNVHPTKHEVRFSEPRMVHDFIAFSLKETLQIPIKPSFAKTVDYIPTALETVNISHRAIALPTVSYKTNKPDAIIANQFILITHEQQVFIIHYQNAYHYLCKQSFQNKTMRAQPLLLPESITLTVAQIEKLIPWQDSVEAFGIEWRITSPQTVLIKKCPEALKGCVWEDLLVALAQINDAEKIMDQLMKHIVFEKVLSQATAQKTAERILNIPLTELESQKICYVYDAKALEKLFK
jgi:DNA mismatch repair protein MutL